MNTNKNYKLAITGAFGALVIVLGITRLGFISVDNILIFSLCIGIVCLIFANCKKEYR